MAEIEGKVGINTVTFEIVFDKDWQLELGSERYVIISEPKKVKGGYEYKIERYETK